MDRIALQILKVKNSAQSNRNGFDRERFATFAHVCGGFLLGMCAVYIAMHVYRWK